MTAKTRIRKLAEPWPPAEAEPASPHDTQTAAKCLLSFPQSPMVSVEV
jgi:hypothetical protein